MPLKPIGKGNLVQSVVESIVGSVKNGTFNPGDRLPSIKEISEALRVSIGSVREGLKQLQSMGIIRIQHGVGTYVTDSINFQNLLDSYKNLITLQEKNFDEVMEARVIIECETSRLAAERADKEEQDALAQLVSSMKRCVNNAKEYNMYDVEFHMTIAKASKNTVLVTFLESIQGLISSIVEEMLFIPKQSETANINHESICLSINNGNASNASTNMKKHLMEVQKTARRYIYKEE